MAEDSAEYLTPALLDIIDSKARSMREEFRRYPLIGFRSDWTIAKGLSTLALACGVALTMGGYNFFFHPSSEQTSTSEKTSISQIVEELTLEAEDGVVWYKNYYLDQAESGFNDLALTIKKEYDPLIAKAVSTIQQRTKFKVVDEGIIKELSGLIVAESSGRPNVVNKDVDRGLCQIRPDAEEDARITLGWGPVNILDPEVNITLALTYLMQQMGRFGGNPVLAVSAYNVGPGTIQDFLDQNGSDVDPYKNPGINYYYKVRGARAALAQAQSTLRTTT